MRRGRRVDAGREVRSDGGVALPGLAATEAAGNAAAGGAFEIDLPTSPSVGDEVTVIDTRGTFASNNLTFDRNGQPINSGTSNLALSTAGQAVTLVYVDATRGWAFKTNTA